MVIQYMNITEIKKEGKMKKLLMLLVALLMVLGIATNGYCAIKYVGPYVRSDGTYVSGCWKDTSHDGNPYNNANYLGLNN